MIHLLYIDTNYTKIQPVKTITLITHRYNLYKSLHLLHTDTKCTNHYTYYTHIQTVQIITRITHRNNMYKSLHLLHKTTLHKSLLTNFFSPLGHIKLISHPEFSKKGGFFFCHVLTHSIYLQNHFFLFKNIWGGDFFGKGG